jgi:tRNA pseudouridine38-40 synthase
MPTYRMDLAYDGSGFRGYAKQPHLRTVQGELEAALFVHTGEVDTSVAGRTDKGVHATDQVVSFTSESIDAERVQRSLNRQLSPGIAVHRIVEVEDGFHARFSATGRAYRYRILNARVHDPFRSTVTWTYPDPLDADVMNTSVRCLIGEHDFAAFCRKQGDRSTTRHVLWTGWRRDGGIVELSIGATSFCHQMVRSIVAVSVEVGRGRLGPWDTERILRSGDRAEAKGSAPPNGLTLVAVSYADEPLPRPSWIPEIS